MGFLYVWKGLSLSVDKIIKDNSKPVGGSFAHKWGNVLVLFTITGVIFGYIAY